MAQTAKFIDLTKSFTIIDPNAFPESLHSGRGESSPEDPIPVRAYAGKNFMPTAAGYKSFFGTTQKLDGDPLETLVDDIFTYQSVTFQNTLVALCADGIYTRAGASPEAWVKRASTYDLAETEEEESYYPWTYCVIENKLFAYQQGRGTFWQITSDATNATIFTEKTPNFLNMEGQVGIFKAGGRLGFWDTANSVAWSNLDDVEDFTPSTTTLAGSAVFTEVTGTIVAIKGHGDGFMIYATKSIIWIQRVPEVLFQWEPKPVFTNNGVAYAQQVAVSSPDTLHFAYTGQGLFAIESGKAEVIVPEVFDFFEESTSVKFLKILNGRYLAVHTTDTSLLSRTNFTTENTGDFTLTLPGVNLTLQEAWDAVTISGDLCSLTSQFGNYAGQAPATGDLPEDAASSPLLQPVYKAFFRMPSVVEPPTVTFTAATCPVSFNGETIAMQPVEGTIAALNSNYREVAAADLYVDGILTMERFVQIQTALWDTEAAALESLAEQIAAKAEFRSRSVSCGNSEFELPAPTFTQCVGRTIPTKVNPSYMFNISPCSFSLTRMITEVADVITRQYKYHTNVWNVREMPASGKLYTSSIAGTGYSSSTLQGLVDAITADRYPTSTPTITHYPLSEWSQTSGGQNCGTRYTLGWTLARVDWSGGGGPAIVTWSGCTTDGEWRPLTEAQGQQKGGWLEYLYLCEYRLTEWLETTNRLRRYPVSLGDTAYAVLTGWNYRKQDGTTGFIARSETCESPNIGDTSDPKIAPSFSINPSNGALCSSGFEPVTIPGTPAYTVTWPEQTVTYPGTDFLLRNGTPAPWYATFQGAHVYDLHLKKWGKYVGEYKHLLDYQAINAGANGILTDANFGIIGGMLDTSGEVRLFDTYPTESSITYGKIGYRRNGFTSLEEFKVNFTKPAIGKLKVETSLDGRLVEPAITKQIAFSDAKFATLYGAYPGKWHQVTISGWYEISYMEYKGFTQGYR